MDRSETRRTTFTRRCLRPGSGSTALDPGTGCSCYSNSNTTSVRMSDFLSRYVKACEKKSLSPLPCVLESCRNGSPSLDVSTNCLSAGACGVLGRCLRGGHPFVDLNFSDCLVGDEGLYS